MGETVWFGRETGCGPPAAVLGAMLRLPSAVVGRLSSVREDLSWVLRASRGRRRVPLTPLLLTLVSRFIRAILVPVTVFAWREGVVRWRAVQVPLGFQHRWDAIVRCWCYSRVTANILIRDKAIWLKQWVDKTITQYHWVIKNNVKHIKALIIKQAKGTWC